MIQLRFRVNSTNSVRLKKIIKQYENFIFFPITIKIKIFSNKSNTLLQKKLPMNENIKEEEEEEKNKK